MGVTRPGGVESGPGRENSSYKGPVHRRTHRKHRKERVAEVQGAGGSLGQVECLQQFPCWGSDKDKNTYLLALLPSFKTVQLRQNAILYFSFIHT